jgi:phosphate transporter
MRENAPISNSNPPTTAFACNFGGMLTPIASMQNIIAIQQMNSAESPMTFGQWIIYAMPIALTGTVFAWLLIIVMLKPDDVTSIPRIIYEEKGITKTAVGVCVLSLLTILAWATSR